MGIELAEVLLDAGWSGRKVKTKRSTR